MKHWAVLGKGRFGMWLEHSPEGGKSSATRFETWLPPDLLVLAQSRLHSTLSGLPRWSAYPSPLMRTLGGQGPGQGHPRPSDADTELGVHYAVADVD